MLGLDKIIRNVFWTHQNKLLQVPGRSGGTRTLEVLRSNPIWDITFFRDNDNKSLYLGVLSCKILYFGTRHRILWCSEASGLLGMTAGVFQSMWPRLKSPLTQMFEFVFLHKTRYSLQ
jgi:hypothetical protein